MPLKLAFKRFAVFIIVATFIFSPVFVGPNPVFAGSLEEELEEIERELAEIRDEKGDLQAQIDQYQRKVNGYSGEIGALQAEVEKYQLEVSELELEIKELTVSIEILEEQIDTKEKIITQRLEEIGVLEDVTVQRLRTGYAEYRLNKPDENNILTTTDINEYFKASQYRQLLQQRTNDVLADMVEEKLQLEYDREQLADKKAELAKDKEIIKEQQEELNKKQEELEAEMEAYYGALYSVQGQVNGLQNELGSLSEEEAKKQAQAEKVRQAIFNNFNPLSDGTYVVKGTMIGRQGATGMATGPHVHFMVHHNGGSTNPCYYVPAGKFGSCSGNGSLAWPLQGSFYYTSAWGNRCLSNGHCGFHDAIDIAHSSHNAPVFAAHDGYLRKGVDQYGGLYIIICENSNCNSGWKTGYWHFSSY